MNATDNNSKRIHALDSLRAILMLLGIFLHTSLTYTITPHGDIWPIKDPTTTHIFYDFIVLFIHSFRMPIFFLLAGFFGALLYYERSPFTMVKNRALRIVLPFVIFLIILSPVITFLMGYISLLFSGAENALVNALEIFSSEYAFIPQSTFHLWFLYYLILITGFTVVLAMLIKYFKSFAFLTQKSFSWIFQRPILRVLFFSGLLFFLLSALGTSMVESSITLIPELRTFVYFFFFYLLGWLTYKSKQHLPRLLEFDWACTITAILLVVIKGVMIDELGLAHDSDAKILTLLSAFTVCLFTFGIMGLFLRHANKHSKRMRYISDASYWVYLIHLPIVAFVPACIWELKIPSLLKYCIVVLITMLICFVSYHYLVRNSLIGKLLNGKKYSQGL